MAIIDTLLHAPAPIAAPLWRDIARAWQRRRERKELLAMSEHDLHDIGLTRGDAIHEAEKPFWRA